MTYPQVRAYIADKKRISVPMLQKEFGADYRTALKYIQKLLDEKLVSYDKGIYYTVCANKQGARGGMDKRWETLYNTLEGSQKDELPFTGNMPEDPELQKYFLPSLKLCITRQEANAQLLRRVLLMSYLTACRLIVWMESNGYISSVEDSEPRRVLITMEQFDILFG